MPEPNFLSLYSFTPEPPKKSPIIKVSCGIGDTDGFPAFDVDSEQYAAKDDPKWGFLITGGAEFHMPLTVFQVTPDGLADKGGICLGDIILEINEEDATQLTLSQAHEKIDASGKKIQFLLKSMDEEESMAGYEPGEEKSIVLRVPKPPPPPKEFTPTPLLGSRCWHPIMWTEPPPPPKPKKKKTKTEIDEEGNEVIIELSEDESSEDEEEENRKLSYDEDVYDYELSDDDKDEGNVNKDEFDAKEAYLQLKRYAARQRKSKEVTPESDYASESNYPAKETNNEDQDDQASVSDDNDIAYDGYNYHSNAPASVTSTDDDDDTEKSCDMYEEFNLPMLKASFSQICNESDIEEYDGEEVVEKDMDDGEDFLTTTLTWNLRYKPKLQINDTDDDEADNDDLHKRDNPQVDEEDEDKFDVVQKESLNKPTEMLCLNLHAKADTPEKDQKLDKLERSWPWADREKIIYKQSTCHLVPHKPLGLIEQRIQLLAKSNLLQHINRINNLQ